MFGFLKDKLKSAIKKFTGDVKEEVQEKVETKVEKVEKTEKVEKVEKQVSKPVVKEIKEDKKHHEKIIEKHVEKVEKKEEVKPIIKEDKKEVKESKEKIHTHSHTKKEEPKQEIKIKNEEKIKHVEKVEKVEEKEEIKPVIKEEKKELKEEKQKISHDLKHEVKTETKKHIPSSKQVEQVKHEKHELKHETKHELKKEHVKPEIKEVIEEKIEEKKPEPKKGFFKNLFSKKSEETKKEDKKSNVEDTKEEKEIEEVKEMSETKKVSEHAQKSEIFDIKKEEPIQVKEPEPKKGFFEKLTEVVTKKNLSEEKFDELFFELEVAMLENNVALEVIDKIKNDLKKSLLSEKVSRVKTEEIIANSLKESIEELFDVKTINLIKSAENKKPLVICFVGVNGSGKTTNLAKLANYLQKNGLSVVIAACDTFRAAAIQQIEEHANNLNVKLIKHDYGADAAAVAFDAIEHAKSKGKDVVLIDTAGRSHANVNLMEELEKVVRVSKPDLKIFVGDSLTGNDAVDQAKTFNEKVGIDGIILSKVDVDEKGGAAISVSYVTQKPILFIGTGQTYDDFEEFDKEKIISNLGF